MIIIRDDIVTFATMDGHLLFIKKLNYLNNN